MIKCKEVFYLLINGVGKCRIRFGLGGGLIGLVLFYWFSDYVIDKIVRKELDI